MPSQERKNFKTSPEIQVENFTALYSKNVIRFLRLWLNFNHSEAEMAWLKQYIIKV